MILRGSELRAKEAVSVNDGSRLGYIFDMEIDVDDGRILSFIIPGGNRFMGFLGRGAEFVVPIDKVVKVGVDVILIDDSDMIIPGK